MSTHVMKQPREIRAAFQKHWASVSGGKFKAPNRPPKNPTEMTVWTYRGPGKIRRDGFSTFRGQYISDFLVISAAKAVNNLDEIERIAFQAAQSLTDNMPTELRGGIDSIIDVDISDILEFSNANGKGPRYYGFRLTINVIHR